MPRLLISAQQKLTRIHFISSLSVRGTLQNSKPRGASIPTAVSLGGKRQLWDGFHNHLRGQRDNKKLKLPTTDRESQPEQARYPGVIQT